LSESGKPAAPAVQVSVIVPCRNERTTIEGLLEALRAQTIGCDRLEVVVSDGMSTDGTREILGAYSRAHAELRLAVVDNPDRNIPAALNRGIRASSGQVIVRLDAHSQPEPDYIERCLSALTQSGVANAGGVWQIRPSAGTAIARSIAIAGALRLGAGDARYRVSGNEGEVDTVPFGAFHRRWLDRVGGFDESLLSNEDYELNLRLRRAGAKVWFDPGIRSSYYARGDLGGLWKQYARYGYWKARVVRRYPSSLRWRQALPPLFVLASLALAVAGIAFPLAWAALGSLWLVYLIVLLGTGVALALRRQDAGLLPGVPLALGTMHLAWGSAFWWGMIDGRKRGSGGRG